jgi:hypothetical protein
MGAPKECQQKQILGATTYSRGLVGVRPLWIVSFAFLAFVTGLSNELTDLWRNISNALSLKVGCYIPLSSLFREPE